MPEACLLDRDRLAKIETKLDRVLDKQEKFISFDGPIGRIKEEVTLVSESVKAAHMRIDDHDLHISRLTERQWTLWAKAAGVGAGGAGVLWAIVEIAKHLLPRL